jgi:L-ascorbate metabolism protein UlaG (beta-lactamase superfamily)
MKAFCRIITIVLMITLLAACASDPTPMPAFDEEAWLREVQATDIAKLYAPHFNEKEKTFFNPWMLRSERPRPEGARRGGWFNRPKMETPPWPEENYIPQENDYSYLRDKNFSSISFAGHASMIIKMNGETIFTDPFFSNRAAVLSKEVKIKFDYDTVPDRPVVVISHNHYDHLDKQSIKKLIKKNAVFVVPLKLKKYLEGWGAKEVYELDWWQPVKIASLTFTFLPAQHWSMRIAPGQGNSKSLWGGFMIQGEKTVYFSGDTGYFRGFEEFGNKWEIDYAIIGAGAYEPRWFMHYQHLNPGEFLMAARDLKAKTAIPMHFGVISLSDEPLNYPLWEIAERAGYNEGIKLLRVGEYLKM